MSELFEQEKPKRPECCPHCGSVNIVVNQRTWETPKPKKNWYLCNDCGKEVK